MGCSSSTQTQLQDSNRPSSRLEERNGASKCAPDINGPMTDESETIPDHSQLLEHNESDTLPDEVITSEPSPSEVGGVLEVAAEDCLSSEVNREEPEIPAAPMGESSPDADDITEVQPSETEEQTEGETGGKVESEITVDAGVEEAETKDEETQDAVASAVREIMAESKED